VFQNRTKVAKLNVESNHPSNNFLEGLYELSLNGMPAEKKTDRGPPTFLQGIKYLKTPPENPKMHFPILFVHYPFMPFNCVRKETLSSQLLGGGNRQGTLFHSWLPVQQRQRPCRLWPIFSNELQKKKKKKFQQN